MKRIRRKMVAEGEATGLTRSEARLMWAMCKSGARGCAREPRCPVCQQPVTAHAEGCEMTKPDQEC